MEVTTVSPSPASPTEGDDLCEINVTDVATHCVTLLLCLCGLVGNGAVLGLLRQKIHNTAIYGLAFADFLVLVFTVPSTLLFLVEDLSCSPIVPRPYLNFLFQLPVLSCCWALFWLMSTCGLVKVFKHCCNTPKGLRCLVFNVQFWVFFALFFVTPAVTNVCRTQEHQHCRAVLISVYAVILLLLVTPMVIFHTFSFIKAKWGSKNQQPKRHDFILIVIGLFTLLLSLCNFLQQLGYIFVHFQVFFLLNCIHSSIKPFIYFLAGRCWSPCSLRSLQLSLQRVFDDEGEETALSNDAPKNTVV